ncbi:MAG: beta-ketoacyl-[acyl-carrier-protein] synthase family protein [Chitinivibrionales bacterium]|nr:beta-ketoacyl-[acyl-carrier-protein] synthase family protein [Chitinivibrionales bacterium]
MVAITGIGIVCSIGKTTAEVAEAMMRGVDGIAPITRFPTDMFSAHLAALLPASLWDDLGTRYPLIDHRTAMAIHAAEQALLSASAHSRVNEMGLVYGICVGGKHDERQDESEPQTLLRNRLQNQASCIAVRLCLKGPAIVISTACASSTHGLGFACDCIRFGIADAMLVGGAGDVTPEMFAGFHALGVMSSAACAPYSIPTGLTLGEGAAFFVLERIKPGRMNDRRIKGFITGFGSSLDAYNATTPDPTGGGVARAVTAALADAHLCPAQIGYVNAHGTGTAENDKSEWLGIKAALGKSSLLTPVSSSKSFLGHTGGAAGITEAAICAIALENQVVPPTLHIRALRKLAPADPVNAAIPRPHRFNHALSCNAAFAGANAALVLSHRTSPYRQSGLCFFPVVIASTGVLLPCNRDMEEGLPPSNRDTKNTTTTGSLPPLTISNVDLAAYTIGRDERHLDPVTRYLTAACARAMEKAGLRPDEESAVSRGLITGVSHVPSASLDEFENSKNQRGLGAVSAMAFSRIVMNAATGAAAEIMRLKGPTMTIASGEGAGLAALIYACMEMNKNSPVQYLLAAAADELGSIPLSMHYRAGRSYAPAEAGAAVLLRRSATHEDTATVRITGIAMTGPGKLFEAILQSCSRRATSIDCIISACDGSDAMLEDERTGLAGASAFIGTPEVVHIAEQLGYAEASTALCGVAVACAMLRSRPDKEMRILIIASSASSASCSVLIENHPKTEGDESCSPQS